MWLNHVEDVREGALGDDIRQKVARKLYNVLPPNKGNGEKWESVDPDRPGQTRRKKE